MIEEIIFNYSDLIQQTSSIAEASARAFIPLSFFVAFLSYCIRVLLNFFTSVTGVTK